MASITVSANTSVTPRQFIDALTDFGPDRAKLWPNSQPRYLKVHSEDSTSADVTEGSNIFGGVWERLHYDWSNINHITLTTIDSNYWKSGSSWTYIFLEGSDHNKLTLTIDRTPKNIHACAAILFVGIVGKYAIRKQLANSLDSMVG